MGVLLYRALTGEYPFKRGPDLWSERLRGKEIPLDDLDMVDPQLQQIVARCLATDPEVRYPHAAALAEALKEEVRVRRISAEYVTDWIHRLFDVDEEWEGQFSQDTSSTHASMERLIQNQIPTVAAQPSSRRPWLILSMFSVGRRSSPWCCSRC